MGLLFSENIFSNIMLKIYKLLGFTYFVSEMVHYYKLLRRFEHFNKLRNTHNLDEIEELSKVIDINQNGRGDMVNDLTKYNQTDMQCIIKEETECDILKCGSSRIYWRYHTFLMELSFISLRKFGEFYLRWIGYTKKQYLTDDGYYNIWSRFVDNTKPILFFPGLGLGGIPYGKALCYFERTTHIIEVPNLGYATPYSDRQMTSKTLYDVLQNLTDKPVDIVAHSIGTLQCANYINESVRRNDTSNKQIVLMDCFSTKYDILNNHLLPFMGYKNYNQFISIKNTQTRPGYILYCAMLYFVLHQIDCQAFCKRNHSYCSGIFWREYKNINFKYVFAGNEIMMDTRYIITQMKKEDYHFIEHGQHGSCIFGKKRNLTLDVIKKWLN